MFISECLINNDTELKNLKLFENGEIDHTYLKSEDDLNYYLITHGFEDGTIAFNGYRVYPYELEEVIRVELGIIHHVRIEIIACHGVYSKPYVTEGFTICNKYPNIKDEIYFEISEDEETIMISDNPYICKANRSYC